MSVSIFSNMNILLLINSSIHLSNTIILTLFLQSNQDCTSYNGTLQIIISERCSTNYSMGIGGSAIPSSNNSYSMIIFSTYVTGFDSYYGSIYVTGFVQSTYMNGISSGIITISAQTTNTTYQYIEFSEYITSFSNNQHISIIGNRGIIINKNITTTTSSTTFEFISGDIIISWFVYIIINGNINQYISVNYRY